MILKWALHIFLANFTWGTNNCGGRCKYMSISNSIIISPVLELERVFYLVQRFPGQQKLPLWQNPSGQLYNQSEKPDHQWQQWALRSFQWTQWSRPSHSSSQWGAQRQREASRRWWGNAWHSQNMRGFCPLHSCRHHHHHRPLKYDECEIMYVGEKKYLGSDNIDLS